MNKVILCIACGKNKDDDVHFSNKRKLCNACNLQFRRHGKILENHRRSEHIVNDFGEYSEISLSNNKGDIIAWFKVDNEDLENILQHKWYLASDGYAETKNKIRIKAHIFIKGERDGFLIDHINRDRLDNRKSNLRYATNSQNGINKRKQNNNTSGVVGVSFDRSRNKWTAYINTELNKTKFLGRFDNFEDAVNCREINELLIYGESSPKYNELKEKYNEV